MRIALEDLPGKIAPTVAAWVVLVGLLAVANPSGAHCDRMDGPVATAALRALESGRLEAVEIWVGEAQTAELRESFSRARVARAEGPEARDLADRYFVETAVRLHREAEGMPYTGVRPAGQPLPADLEAAENALETGNVGPLIEMLQEELEHEVLRWYDAARQARSDREASVEQGRQWVDAYVEYIVYVHQLHQKIQAPPAHGVGAATDGGGQSR